MTAKEANQGYFSTRAPRRFDMKLTFIKLGQGRYVTHVVRDDGVMIEVPGPDRKAPLPHDLAHYIVESRLGLKGGFWGRVAAGAVFPGMKVLSGRS